MAPPYRAQSPDRGSQQAQERPGDCKGLKVSRVTCRDVLGILDQARRLYEESGDIRKKLSAVSCPRNTNGKNRQRYIKFMRELSDCKNCLLVIRSVLQDAARIQRHPWPETSRAQHPREVSRDLRRLSSGELLQWLQETGLAIGILSMTLEEMREFFSKAGLRRCCEAISPLLWKV